MAEKNYESTVMRMAGNIAAHYSLDLSNGAEVHGDNVDHERRIVQRAVARARAIVAEVQRTEPKPQEGGARLQQESK